MGESSRLGLLFFPGTPLVVLEDVVEATLAVSGRLPEPSKRVSLRGRPTLAILADAPA